MIGLSSLQTRRFGTLPFHVLMIALCFWSICVQLIYRLPGGLFLVLLPVVSIAVGCLTLVLLITHLMGKTPMVEPFKQIFKHMEKWSKLYIMVFCYYSVFIFMNARWDASPPRDHASEVLEIGDRELDLGKPFRYSYARLRGWNNQNKAEWLILHDSEHRELWVGQPILVQIRKGYFNVPWIFSVQPDREKLLTAVLKITPTASLAWRQLIRFYIEHNRWPEAATTTIEYLKIYPNQRDYAIYTAGALLSANRFNDMITLLESLAAARPEYMAYSYLGFALAMTGKKSEGVKYLQSAISLDPDNYWAYYSLGYAHLFSGDYAAAIAPFEKVLKIRPNYPEIEDNLRHLRELVPK